MARGAFWPYLSWYPGRESIRCAAGGGSKPRPGAGGPAVPASESVSDYYFQSSTSDQTENFSEKDHRPGPGPAGSLRLGGTVASSDNLKGRWSAGHAGAAPAGGHVGSDS